ncbi:MAG TPA: hypothetical protein VH183_06630 [Burkholderiaceae bacterium]|jgi:outer membrane lipoprotein-sorting protein|nr:hypothetical protein [Burkholderiaceae bacterium]
MRLAFRCALTAAASAALACSIPLSAPAANAAPEGRQPPLAGQAPADPTADQIVDRSVQARGGPEAWRKVESIVWKGRLESERLSEHAVHFELTEKRPNKVRFEILEPAERVLRVFDGDRGWKVRAGQDGRPTVQPFTEMEVRYAREAPGLNGPLVDVTIKGRTVALEGREKIEGHDCFRLAIRTGLGEKQTVWVDAQTFLELRYDRMAYGEGGPRGVVSVFYRDYRVVEGLALPSLVEIGSPSADKRDRMVVEQVALNPKVPDFAFARPPGAPRGTEVVIPPAPLPRAVLPQAATSGVPNPSPSQAPPSK